jgi:hypothetical protein
MQLVSHSPHTLAFTLILYHSSAIAAQEELAVSQLASPLAYFISPEFTVPPFFSTIYRTLYQDIFDIFTCTQTYYPYRLTQRKEGFVVGVRRGHVGTEM